MPAAETAFTAIRVEGGLFPPEFLQRIAALEAPGQSSADYAIPPGRTVRDEIGRYWTIAEALWKDYQQNRARTDIPAERTGVERWLLRLLRDVLGYADISPATASVVIGERRFPITHRAFAGAVPLLLTVADRDLDRSHPSFAEEGRRRAPHAALQEFLNADAASLWGVLANGPRLRLLRENPSLTRPAYIEADLERIFDEGLYADFAALWLVLHVSRLAPGPHGMAGARIEGWRADAAKTGQRALERLRIGVTTALRELGCGFVEYPDNETLRAALREGTLTAEGLHQQLLRLIYRLLFLFAAEERDLLHAPDMAAAVRKLYVEGYSLSRLRDRARLRRHYDRYPDLWAGMTITFRGLASGAPALGLPALGGLFDNDQCSALDNAALANARLLAGIHALAFFQADGGLQRVNYRDMGTEELGSVYESLLELHPIVQVAARPWSFGFVGDDRKNGEARATERRLSGSYYTPDSLVQEVLTSALNPLIKRTLHDNPAVPRRALLRLRVLDPACGSGHFLLGAARRLAAEVARLDTEGDLPDEAIRRHALREVVQHCIYGVDRNPLAVELCRTALWIESIEPGKPLSFLDAHIRCGDALVGVTDLRVLGEGIPDEAFVPFVGDDRVAAGVFKRMNKAQRESAPTLDLGISLPGEFASSLESLSEEAEDSVEVIVRKRRRLEELRSGGIAWRLRNACDLWTAAFFAKKVAPEIKGRELCPTTDVIWRYLCGTTLYGPLVAETDRLAQYYRFFHWPLEFPDAERDGGFDLIIGNPPWETTAPEAKEFFAAYDPQVRFLSKEDQGKAFEKMKEHPGVKAKWDAYCRDLYAQTNFYKESGRYRMFAPGNLAKGDLNVYRMFVETALNGVRRGGCAAQLVPEGFYNGANAAAIRAAIFERFRLDRVIGFENSRGVWFPSVHTAAKFCLYVAWRKGSTENFCATFRVSSEERLADADRHALTLPVALVREFSPDALTIMEFVAQSDIDVCRKVYARYPKFGEHRTGLPYRIYMREIDMTKGSTLFSENPEGLPLFEGRMIDAYDYRAKGYVGGRGRAAEWQELTFGETRKAILPQWRILKESIPDTRLSRVGQYRIGYGWVASPTNERSLIAALIPPSTICGNSVPTIILEGGSPADLLLWLGVANSLTMDFVVRKRVSLNLAYSIMDTLPFPRDWRRTPGADAIIARTFALSAVGPEMEEFRRSAPSNPGVPQGIIPAENPDIRAQLTAEIDALVAGKVFGLTRDELRYVLNPDNLLGEGSGIETFKALRNRERRQLGEYRTQRLVLKAWDRFEQDGTFQSGQQAMTERRDQGRWH
jgi:hypothetical protein